MNRHDIQLLLYTMKRKWGVRAAFYKVAVGKPDLESGGKAITRIKYTINRLVSSTVKTIRKFEYDIGYLAANKNFTYGGFFESGDRLAVISDELSRQGIEEITMKDYFIINDQRFDIGRVEQMDGDVGYLLHLKRTKEREPQAIHERFVWDRITPTQTIGATI